MLRNIRNTSRELEEPYRENYLVSCESHGGETAEVVLLVREELRIEINS